MAPKPTAERALPARKPVTLIAGQFGSSHFGTDPFLTEALRLTGKETPLVLYIGAANRDNRDFGRALSRVLKTAGAHKVLWPTLAGRKKEYDRARDALESVDFVFVGGGDVEAGMQVLREAGLIDGVHAAARRGAVFVGMSAGAIMLGQRWIRWPHEHADDDEAETYECLGVAPCSLDTHGEGDNWRETRSFATVRARELGRKAKAYAVPSGGALVVDASGSMTARGGPVHVFVARPAHNAEIEQTLEART